MTDEVFAATVRQAIDSLPNEFASQLDNVEIVIEDAARDKNILRRLARSQLLLGLYIGVPKTKRFGTFLLPDKITIYKEPILSLSSDSDDAKRRIRNTVLHEIGHHFGLTDGEMAKKHV